MFLALGIAFPSPETDMKKLYIFFYIFSPTQKFVTFWELYDIFNKLLDPSVKAAFPTSKIDLKIIEAAYGDERKMLREEINFPPSGVCVHRNSFFAQLSKKMSSALITSGILQYWLDYLLTFDAHQTVFLPPPEPKVFAIEDLSFGFTVWLVACGVSTLAFMIEILYFFIKMQTIRFIKSCIGLYLIVKGLPKK